MDGDTKQTAAETCPRDAANVSATSQVDPESQPDGNGLEQTLGPLLLVSALIWIGMLVLLL